MESSSFQELVAAWLAGSCDDQAAEQLAVHCRTNPELLDELARLKGFDRLLHVSLLDAGEDAFVQEVAVRCGMSSAGSDLVRRVRWRLHTRRWAGLAIAAGVLFAAVYMVWRQGQPVAVVARLEAAQWPVGQRVFHPGDALGRGSIALNAGFASLRFGRGAELLVEGPARLDIVSANLVRLHSGSAFAHVPPGAIGFTVEGPNGRVIDKGTDFGVKVGDGTMEVHVLKGLVEAGRGTALQALRENEALEMSALTVSPIPVDTGRFLRDLPPKAERPIGWIHWQFDEAEGAATHPSGVGLGGRAAPAQLLSLAGTSPGPKWTNGQFGSALSFDGEDDYVQTDFPGIGGAAARTVAFWVKVPRDFEPKNGYSMICWGSSQELTEGWQISVNPKEALGPLGRLRVGRIGGPIVGTTDLRDDRWHHVAVVFYGSGQPESSTQILIYIDGEMERTDRKRILAIRTDTGSPKARRVAFGLNIGPANPDPARPPNWRVFRGCLDEVFICDAALTQNQVRDLMTHNRTEAFAKAAPR